MNKTTILLIALLFGANCLAQVPDLQNWPEASKTAAAETMARYGSPDIAHQDMLIWKDRGNWSLIQIDKGEDKHSFPIEHTDMMKNCVSYNVPVEKTRELAEFNGSLTFERTKGLMCARCDKETHNMLVLNLAHDIITNKKTVSQAKQAFANMVRQNMNGANPEYMHRLIFKPQENAADAGENVTGLTKTDLENYRKKFANR